MFLYSRRLRRRHIAGSTVRTRKHVPALSLANRHQCSQHVIEAWCNELKQLRHRLQVPIRRHGRLVTEAGTEGNPKIDDAHLPHTTGGLSQRRQEPVSAAR
jgi:hypothetical protein